MGNLIAHVAAKQAHKSGLLDVKRGFQLLKSREVSGMLKLGALSVGLLFTILLALLEIPLDAVVGFVLPIIGPGIDLMVDGAEFVILPALIAAALLPHFVDRRNALGR